MDEQFVTIRNCHWLHAGIGAVRVVVRAEDAERAAATSNAVLDRPTNA